MLLNAESVASFLNTRDKGEKAQVGYDLTLKSVNRVSGGIVMKDGTDISPYEEVMLNINDDGKFLWQLEPGTYSLTFDQGCKLDNKHTAFIRHRSSILRAGGIITSGVYDPGFEVDEMGAVLIVTETLLIEKGARVAQIIMMENEAAELYDGQFQKDRDYK